MKINLKLSLFLVLLFLIPVAHAQETVTDDDVNAVAKKLYCPVCESTPLDVCPTQACEDWRGEIRTMLLNGEGEQAVLDYFARLYGDGVLAEPPVRGLGWFIWLFPVVAVLLGGGLFARYLRGIQVQETAVETPSPSPMTSLRPPTDAYIARIEAELQAMETQS